MVLSLCPCGINSPQTGKLETKYKCGVRIMYMCAEGAILYVGLSSGSILVIDLEVCSMKYIRKEMIVSHLSTVRTQSAVLIVIEYSSKIPRIAVINN